MIKNENGYPFNVFISYRGTQGKIYADSIYSKLKYHNLRYQDQSIVPFFAPHDIRKGMNFADTLQETIPQIQCFIMILTENYFDDIQGADKSDNMVKLELDAALNQEKLQFIPLIAENSYGYWDDKSYFGEEFTPLQKKRFRRVNPIYYSEDYFFDAERSLIPALQEILKKNSCMENNFRAGRASLGQRIKNDRFLEIEGETQRLLEQQQLLQSFDLPTYTKVFKKKPKYILDVGSNDGSALMQRIQKSNYQQYEKIIGLDISDDLVDLATKKFAGDPKIKYYLADVESPSFLSIIRQIMLENSIEYFDFINISSVLLQLEDPFAFLLAIDEIVNPDSGQILIVDVDDGLNIAYPDPNQTFSRVFDICNRCEMTGFRKTGRQIFTLLSKATDCKKISFEKSGLNTSNMSKSERRVFYDVVFQFIGAALEKELNENPNAIDLQLESEWFAEHKNQIRDEFFNNDFFFSFGYIIFLAQK